MLWCLQSSPIALLQEVACQHKAVQVVPEHLSQQATAKNLPKGSTACMAAGKQSTGHSVQSTAAM